MAADKGCNGVEPDVMDAYDNGSETLVPITAQHQLTYNKFIASKAHELGLAVGLKNDIGQLGLLVNDFDFAINEECFYYSECTGYSTSFIAQDKPVFGVEYKEDKADPALFCPKALSMKFSWQLKNLAMDAYRVGCEKYA